SGKSKSLSKEMALRREIEEFHKPSAAGTAEKMWEYLGHEDRFVRYAARIAIEHQPIDSWKDLVFKEKNVVKLTEGMMALVRNADPSMQDQIYAKLGTIEADKLPANMLLNLVRVYEVSIARLGNPTAAQSAIIAKRFDGLYPSKVNLINRTLGKVLVAIGDPSVVQNTMAILNTAKDDSSSTNFM